MVLDNSPDQPGVCFSADDTSVTLRLRLTLIYFERFVKSGLGSRNLGQNFTKFQVDKVLQCNPSEQ